MRIRTLLRNNAIWDWAFRISAIASLILAGIAFQNVQNTTACQTRYNEINNARTRYLTQTNNEERNAERYADDAQAALFTSPILSRPVEERTIEEKRQLEITFKIYQEALIHQAQERIEADKARESNPVPPPPSVLCD